MFFRCCLLLGVALLFGQPNSALADTLVFDFDTVGVNGADLDAAGSAGSTTATGTSVTLTLAAAANSGNFNQTGTGFGINAAGSDDTDAIDGGGDVDEMITFSISGSDLALTSLSLVSIEFDRFSGSGSGSLVFSSGGSSTTFLDSDLSGSNVLSVNEAISIGQTFTLSHVNGAGNGFGLEQITFEAITAVPEPSAALALAICCGTLATRRRR